MAYFTKRRVGWGLASLIVVAAVMAGGCVWVPLAQSTSHFVSLPEDTRVRYEPGAEQNARIVAKALPHAVKTVEGGHQQPFPKPIVVYVCATEKSFESYGFGVKGAGGFVFGERLFLSPKPVNTAERLPRVLTHELSHLHLEQMIGSWRATSRLPGWFKEGLAVVVSNGAGAETVSETQARRAIVEGRVFHREGTGSLLFPQTAAREGLPAHLFYRESALFVDFLRHSSREGFARMLQEIYGGKKLSAAVQSGFGRDLDGLWEEFTRELAER